MNYQETINILSVEDNPGDVQLVELMLQESQAYHFNNLVSTNLADAVDKINSEKIDVVLLDMSLPDGEGIENISRIKMTDPKLPIVIMTGNQDEELAVNALREGAQDYMIKGRIDEWNLSRALRYSIERKSMQEKITYMANHDQLTGLVNRMFFRTRFEHIITASQRREEAAAVLYIDLDHFKEINDNLGHAIGDALLVNVANRLKEVVRKVDTIARLGGDEFAILLENVHETYNVANVADKIIKSISRPYEINEHVLHIGCSIGIAVYPHCGKNIDAILNCADTALYKAKQQGRNQYQFYSNEMHRKALSQLNTEYRLRKALEEKEFVLHYQPQYDIKQDNICGVEALLRWQHPEKGLIPPASFIPLLEKNGLIEEVGKWVLKNACEQFNRWQESGLAINKMAINLSGRQLIQSDFSDKVENIIVDTGMNPDCLQLELTESLLIKNMSATKTILDTFKAMGISIAIDDFGTGYNSFHCLNNLSFDTLKIDKSFIKNLKKQIKDTAICAAVISLAKDMGIRVVAEGVETFEQLKFLKQKRIDEIQGYYMSPPVAPENIEDVICLRCAI